MTAEAAARLGIEMVSLDDLFRRADFITVHTPLTDDTRGLVGAAAFARMKKGVRIINCARGGIVDEAALADAIESGKVAGAALDVFVEEPPPADHPLLKLTQVIATPHLGAATDEAQVQVARRYRSPGQSTSCSKATIRHAVNIPALSPKELETLLTASESGRAARPIGRATYPRGARRSRRSGSAARPPISTREPIIAAVLKGLMSAFLDEPLNYVNAPFIARERGINMVETRSRETTDYINTLTLTVHTPAGVA